MRSFQTVSFKLCFGIWEKKLCAERSDWLGQPSCWAQASFPWRKRGRSTLQAHGRRTRIYATRFSQRRITGSDQRKNRDLHHQVQEAGGRQFGNLRRLRFNHHDSGSPLQPEDHRRQQHFPVISRDFGNEFELHEMQQALGERVVPPQTT